MEDDWGESAEKTFLKHVWLISDKKIPEQLADKGVPEVKAAADVNKWAGEDEEEEVKVRVGSPGITKRYL